MYSIHPTRGKDAQLSMQRIREEESTEECLSAKKKGNEG